MLYSISESLGVNTSLTDEERDNTFLSNFWFIFLYVYQDKGYNGSIFNAVRPFPT